MRRIMIIFSWLYLGIWRQRNEQMWKGEHIPSTKVVLFALDYLFDWIHAR